MSTSNPLARIFETDHLTGINFKDQLRNLKIVLTSEKIGYIFDQDGPALPAHPTIEQRAILNKQMDDDLRVKYYVLASISNELQSQYEHMPTVRTLITHLQELYSEQSQTVHFELSKQLFNMKMHEGQLVHDHCMTMIKDLEELKKLGINI